jgi:hypothetical protein
MTLTNDKPDRALSFCEIDMPKLVVSLLGLFAGYYLYFLSSVFCELYGPNDRFCATAQFWALQGAAIFFAPPALLGCVVLWFIAKRKDAIGTGFSRASKIALVILGLCAGVNLLMLVPAP